MPLYMFVSISEKEQTEYTNCYDWHLSLEGCRPLGIDLSVWSLACLVVLGAVPGVSWLTEHFFRPQSCNICQFTRLRSTRPLCVYCQTGKLCLQWDRKMGRKRVKAMLRIRQMCVKKSGEVPMGATIKNKNSKCTATCSYVNFDSTCIEKCF